MNRAMMSVFTFGAIADAAADIVYNKASASMTFLRPTWSAIGPTVSAANVAAMVGALTTKPICQSSRLNSGVMKPMTPEMTAASKPNRNPPSAIIVA